MTFDSALAEPRPTRRAGRPVRSDGPTRSARPGALCGPQDGDEAMPRAPLADIHIDLPDDGESDDADALVELPIEGDADGGDTQRMPL